MKLYDCQPAPNPRRVRIFMAEKGIEIPTVQVDFANREQLSDAFRAKNPFCDIPVLELDDGTCISQINGICRYLEAAYPEPNLYGRDAKEQGLIAMWDNYAALHGIGSVADGFRNFAPVFGEHAVLGTRKYQQIPALAERGRMRTEDFFNDMNNFLADREYVICDRFTAADITTMVTIDFAKRIKVGISETQPHLQRWYNQVSARPSAKA